MLYLDRFKLETILGNRGLSINKLSEQCGVSRQSIYNMYETTPVFNTTFEKIRQFLNVDYRAVTLDSTLAHEIMKHAPDRIKIATYVLSKFSEENNADLLLFSGVGKCKLGQKFDWNFAIHFNKKDLNTKLMSIRQDLLERTAPYFIEIINLTRAPLWLRLIIKTSFIRIYGNTAEDVIFYSDR